MKTFPKACGYF